MQHFLDVGGFLISEFEMIPESESESDSGIGIKALFVGIRIGNKYFFGNTGIGIRIGITCYGIMNFGKLSSWIQNWNQS